VSDSKHAVPDPGLRPRQVNHLFRQQVVARAGGRQYGSVILDRSIGQSLITGLVMAIVAAILAFFAFFSTTRKAQCQGILLPGAGVIRVLPGIAGVIVDKRVREGQSVKAGDVLFVLSGERSIGDADAVQKTISTLLRHRRDSFNEELVQASSQSRQRIAAAQGRAASLSADIERAAGQVVLQQRRVALAEQAQARFSELQAKRFISEAQWQEKQAELLDQQQRLAELLRMKAASEREREAAQAEAGDLHMQAQRDAHSLQRGASSVEQDLSENEARREVLVRAPTAGIVTAITADLGQAVGANAMLASVLPAGADLEAEIYVPSRSIGFVKQDMQVLLRYQAYPHQKFGQYAARVSEIAHTTLRPVELDFPGAGSGAEPLYRIRLKLDKQTVVAYGKPMPLQSGMLVDASIVLEQRRLYEWILEPLFSISGRM
jgi:membrane fusion protein